MSLLYSSLYLQIVVLAITSRWLLFFSFVSFQWICDGLQLLCFWWVHLRVLNKIWERPCMCVWVLVANDGPFWGYGWCLGCIYPFIKLLSNLNSQVTKIASNSTFFIFLWVNLLFICCKHNFHCEGIWNFFNVYCFA